MNPPASADVTRILLLVLLTGLLIAGTFWTMLPFLGPLIWATTIVVATWPLMLRVERGVGGRRSIATTIMTLIVLAAVIVPFAIAISTLIDAANRGPEVARDFLSRGLGAPPEWLGNLPFVGERAVERWQSLAAAGPEGVVEAAKPYVRAAASWAVAATGGLGIMLLNVLITVILIAILYAQGEIAARGVLSFAYRLGRERGEQTMRLAGQAVRSVALGVIVTALVQSILAGLGLWITGIPHAGILTALVFVLGIAQLGPLPIMLPAVIWLYWSGHPGWGTVLLIWSIPVIALDNVLRPILIRRGVQLPMLLIIAGVIGGLIGFGVLGLFIGPVILAATYTLTNAWIAEGWPDDAAKRTST